MNFVRHFQVRITESPPSKKKKDPERDNPKAKKQHLPPLPFSVRENSSKWERRSTKTPQLAAESVTVKLV